jgi:hypothetical protein
MKKNKFLLAVILFCSLLACSKSKDAAEPPTQLGYWTGAYTYEGVADKQNCAIYVKPDGTFRYYEMMNYSDTTELTPGLKVTGTWVMINDTFMMTLFLNNNTRGLQASLQRNEPRTQMSGLWKADGEIMGMFDFAR